MGLCWSIMGGDLLPVLMVSGRGTLAPILTGSGRGLDTALWGDGGRGVARLTNLD